MVNCVFTVDGSATELCIERDAGALRLKCLKGNSDSDKNIFFKDVIKVEEGSNPNEFTIHSVVQNGSQKSVKCTAVMHQDSEVVNKWVADVNTLYKEASAGRPKSLLIFVNPLSGAAKGVQIYDEQVQPLFDLASIKTEIVVTEAGDHPSKVLSQRDLSAYDGVVCVGGDGTFTQVANGLMARAMKDAGRDVHDEEQVREKVNLPFGFIPAGTGQAMATIFHHCRDVVTAAVNIILGDWIPCHVMSVHSGGKLVWYTTLLNGVGLFSDVITTTEKSRWMGRIRYLYSVIRTLFSIRRFDAEVQYVEAKESTDSAGAGDSQDWKTIQGCFTAVTAFVCEFSLDRSKPGPGAHYEDNAMLLSLFREDITMLGVYRAMSRLAMGKPNPFDGIQAINCRVSDVKISVPRVEGSDEGHVLDLDGEPVPIHADDFRIRLHVGAMRTFGLPRVTTTEPPLSASGEPGSIPQAGGASR